MRKNTYKFGVENKNSGFTLIEIALVIMIIGIFAAVLAQMAKHYVLEKKEAEQEEAIDVITSALANFVRDNTRPDPDGAGPQVGSFAANAHYPCPADPALPRGAAGSTRSLRNDAGGNFFEQTYGRDWVTIAAPTLPEDVNPAVGFGNDPVVPNIDCAFGGGTGIQRINDGAGNFIYVGAVPTGTLGIDGEFQYDAHGNKYTYAVSRNSALTLVQSTARFTRLGAVTPVPPGSITINTYDFATATTPPVATGVQFLILSHGEDGAGAFNAQGNQIPCPGGAAIENENCNGDVTFLDLKGLKSSVSGNNYVDDEMTFSLMGQASEEDDGFWRLNPNDGNEIHNVNQGGYVGVGVVDPLARLEIAGPAVPADFSVSSQGTISIQGTTNNGFGCAGCGPNGQSVAHQNSGEAGSPYIETPWLYTHNVQATGERQGSGTGIAFPGSALGDGTAIGADQISLYNQGQSRIFITAAGDVGIGNMAPAERLEVTGNILANTYLHSSDKRLKKDIVDLPANTLEDLMMLRIIKYTLIDQEIDTSQKIGLIAQSLREHFPELVHENSNGYLSVDYVGLIGPVIKSVQELRTEKNEEIKKLRNLVNSLEERIGKLEEK